MKKPQQLAISRLRKNAKVHGSIYPGPAKYQDLRYAALVEKNIQKRREAQKREEEAVA